jgi:hypothetical protein
MEPHLDGPQLLYVGYGQTGHVDNGHRICRDTRLDDRDVSSWRSGDKPE